MWSRTPRYVPAWPTRSTRLASRAEPAQCQASGFILDLAPSVDPNEFASTLPKGADVLAWKTVT